MTQFITDFQTCGEYFLQTYCREATGKSGYLNVSTPQGDTVPLRGFGATLAVACFIYDLDCLGRSGGNMGYVIQKDTVRKSS